MPRLVPTIGITLKSIPPLGRKHRNGGYGRGQCESIGPGCGEAYKYSPYRGRSWNRLRFYEPRSRRPVPSQRYVVVAGETSRDCFNHTPDGLTEQPRTEDLAHMFNAKLQGYINYYGRFYKSALYPLFQSLNRRLSHWASRKFKKLRRHKRRSEHWLGKVCYQNPNLFAHWRLGVRPPKPENLGVAGIRRAV